MVQNGKNHVHVVHNDDSSNSYSIKICSMTNAYRDITKKLNNKHCRETNILCKNKKTSIS